MGQPERDGQEDKQDEAEKRQEQEDGDELDPVEEASNESFPASDPPAFTHTHIRSSPEGAPRA